VPPHVALTIAGSDPSGGAGIQADLKTFHQFGVYGEAAIALLTVQNTRTVTRVEILEPELVEQQVRAVIVDTPPNAVKTGALGNAAVVRCVARLAPELHCPLVVDPVMISKHGAPLIAAEAREALWSELLPRATLITPNLHEAAALTGLRVESLPEMRAAALRLHAHTGAAVLVKGGHLEGDAVDLLWDGAALNRAYRATQQRLEAWLAGAAHLPTPQAARESFFLGGAAIRQLVYDPLLPEPMVDGALRQAFIHSVHAFDAAGRAIWNRFYDTLPTPDTAPRKARLRVACGAIDNRHDFTPETTP